MYAGEGKEARLQAPIPCAITLGALQPTWSPPALHRVGSGPGASRALLHQFQLSEPRGGGLPLGCQFLQIIHRGHELAVDHHGAAGLGVGLLFLEYRRECRLAALQPANLPLKALLPRGFGWGYARGRSAPRRQRGGRRKRSATADSHNVCVYLASAIRWTSQNSP